MGLSRRARPWTLGLFGAIAIVGLTAVPWVIAQNGTGTCVENLQIQVEHDARRITLTWNATPGAEFYDVHRAVDGGASEHIGTVGGTTTTFVDDPAPEGVLDYRVAADGHPSLDCPAVSAHIGGEPVPPGEQACAGGLEATARQDGSIRIDWTAVPGAVSYEVLRAEGDDALAPFAVVNGDTTFFVDESTVPGVTYRYAVSANALPPAGVSCEEVTVTAIPFFPSLAAGALAGVAGVAALVALRRRAA